MPDTSAPMPMEVSRNTGQSQFHDPGRKVNHGECSPVAQSLECATDPPVARTGKGGEDGGGVNGGLMDRVLSLLGSMWANGAMIVLSSITVYGVARNIHIFGAAVVFENTPGPIIS